MTYEGKYVIKFGILFFIKPRLTLYTSKKNGKLRGKLSIFRKHKKLNIIKTNPDEFLLQMKVDFIIIDVVISFVDGKRLRGFLDTPIGNIHFIGTRMEGT